MRNHPAPGGTIRARFSPARLPGASGGYQLGLWILLAFTLLVQGEAGAGARGPAQRGFEYLHDGVADVPWSIHILKIDRSHRDLELRTTMGKGRVIGMGTVSEQVKAMTNSGGVPVAAVNGDFYSTGSPIPGDPEGLQIVDGELVSAPSRKVAFWIDPAGNPCRTNVTSQFRVTWPDGSSTPFGLNEERNASSAVLYTAAIGSSTRSPEGGVEIILESPGSGRWLPLEIGQTYPARIRSIREGGNTPLGNDVMILSVGPNLAAGVRKQTPGSVIQLSTATSPDLAGVKTALGGGPALVTGGKANQWSGFEMRHPRTALGWNDKYIFLVVVDGRQRGLSVGMTLGEMGNYMLKLGCTDAMNLDGGGSATMWVAGGVANSPSEGRERPAANALVLMQQSQK